MGDQADVNESGRCTRQSQRKEREGRGKRNEFGGSKPTKRMNPWQTRIESMR